VVAEVFCWPGEEGVAAEGLRINKLWGIARGLYILLMVGKYFHFYSVCIPNLQRKKQKSSQKYRP